VARAGGRPLAVARVVADAAGRSLADPRIALEGARALGCLRRVGAALAEWGAAVGPGHLPLAGPRSFRPAVERAVAIVEPALAGRGAPVDVRRPIVHDGRVVADLERRSAVFVEELHEVPEGATVLCSAHGVTAAVRPEASARAPRVRAATTGAARVRPPLAGAHRPMSGWSPPGRQAGRPRRGRRDRVRWRGRPSAGAAQTMPEVR
jgi:4-hydroxy-3-methylbut-2-enyl diphosphate reductase